MMDMDPVPVRDRPAVLGENISPVVIDRSGLPCRPHEVPDLLARAFPSLFPKGDNADYRHYVVPLTTAEMLAHTVRFADPRFSRHYRYIFMMVNVKNLDAAFKSIGALLNGRVLRTRAGGVVEDVTEEISRAVTRVVCLYVMCDEVTLQNYDDTTGVEELGRRIRLLCSKTSNLVVLRFPSDQTDRDGIVAVRGVEVTR